MISYIDSNLLENERVIRKIEWHWVNMLVVYFSYLILPLGIILHVMMYLKLKSSEVAVTNQRFMMKVGLISRNTIEYPLDQITQTRIHQGLFERIFNSGKIIIKVDGQEHSTQMSIKDPNLFKQSLQQAIADYKKQIYGGTKS